MTAAHRRELAALTALIQLGKSLAGSISFLVSTGQLQASERTFASGQLREFDAAWNEYGAIVKEDRRVTGDRRSKLAYKVHSLRTINAGP